MGRDSLPEQMIDRKALPTWGSLLRDATHTLASGGVPAPRRAAVWLLGDVLGCSAAHLIAYPDREVSREHLQTLAPLLERCAAREPIQYVLGGADFCGMRLRVTPDVLIPRPETEQVVETALQDLPVGAPARVLDIGTGSGCIALAIKRARPNARVTAGDVSAAALRIAKQNAKTHDLAITFLQADMLAPDFVRQVSGSWDLIVSNPPYLAREEASSLEPEIREHEPDVALYSGADPLQHYRAIASHAPRLLAANGSCVLEVHAHRADAVADLLRSAGLRSVAVQPDLAGLPRIVSGRRHGVGG